MNRTLIEVASRMDGIEAFSRGLKDVEIRIGAREIICDNRHQWDGMTERRSHA
jgi:hypothetical protein